MDKLIKIKGRYYSSDNSDRPVGKKCHRFASRGRRIALKKDTAKQVKEELFYEINLNLS